MFRETRSRDPRRMLSQFTKLYISLISPDTLWIDFHQILLLIFIHQIHGRQYVIVMNTA